MPKSAEFILNPSLSQIVVIEPHGPAFAAVLEKLSQNTAVQVIECVSAMDALAVIRQLTACVILAHVRNASDVAQHLTLLKMIANQGNRKSLRMLVTSMMNDEEIDEKLAVAGVNEVTSEPIALKALLFKIERHLKSLPQSTPEEKNVSSAVVSAGAAPDSTPQEVEFEPAIRLGPLLSLPLPGFDCFALADGGARFARGRWQVTLQGPSPEAGRWVSSEGAESSWRWKTYEAAKGEEGPGDWFWFGPKPEYRKGLWHFSAERPVLGFFKGGDPIGLKLSLNAKGTLVVAADSPEALQSVNRAKLLASDASMKSSAHREEAPSPRPSSFLGTPEVILVEALGLKSDFWLINDLRPTRIGGRWLINLVGPGPVAGRWVAKGTEDSASSGEQWWEWMPWQSAEAADSASLLKEEGSWFYFGAAPALRDDVWFLVSTAPQLVFLHAGESLGAKFQVREDGALVVARDSENALAALPLIERSLDPKRIEAASKTNSHPSFTVRLEGSHEALVEPPRLVPSPSASESMGPAPERTPLLSPIALAFLASELMARPDLDLAAKARRYCAHVSHACGGLKVELWVKGAEGSNWQCAGTSEKSEDESGAAAIYGRIVSIDAESGPVAFAGLPAWAVPTGRGTLVIGGPGAEGLKSDYVSAAARMAWGLVKAYNT